MAQRHRHRQKRPACGCQAPPSQRARRGPSRPQPSWPESSGDSPIATATALAGMSSFVARSPQLRSVSPARDPVVDRHVPDRHDAARCRLIARGGALADTVGETATDGQIKDDRIAVIRVMRACQSVTPRVGYRRADRTRSPIPYSRRAAICGERGFVMRVAGVSLALTRAVLARGSSSCPSCNGRLVRARCAPMSC